MNGAGTLHKTVGSLVTPALGVLAIVRKEKAVAQVLHKNNIVQKNASRSLGIVSK